MVHPAVAANRTTGARNTLGEEVDCLLADFCAANFSAPATQIIRIAVKKFIYETLENEPEMKKRFDDARKERLGQSPLKVVSITPKA